MKSKASPTPRDLGLKSDSFVSGFDTELPPRAIAIIEGLQKAGKDHFAFTAPGPIVVFNFDQGLEGVAEKFIKRGKSITVAGIRGSQKQGKYPSYHFAKPVPAVGQSRRDAAYLDRVKKAATPIWEQFIIDLDEFHRSEARTGIIDTGGAAFALAKMAFHGMEKGRPDPKADPYGAKTGEMKTIFQGLITDGYNYDKNVLWLHRVKDEWKNNSPTGGYVTDGYNQAGFEVQLTVRVKKTLVKGRRGDPDEIVRTAIVRDCRIDSAMEGEEFEGKLCNFASVMAAVYGTDLEVWE